MTAIELERQTEVLAGGNVRSTIAEAHLQWVRDYHGEGAVDAVLADLPDSALREVRDAEQHWISFESLIVLDRAIEKRFGRGRRGFLHELGRYSAHRNLAGRSLSGEAIHDVFGRATLFHRQFQDFGTVTYIELAATSGRMIHGAYRCYSPVYCASAIGHYEQVLVMHQAIPLRVEEVSCQCSGDASCTFELQWA